MIGPIEVRPQRLRMVYGRRLSVRTGRRPARCDRRARVLTVLRCECGRWWPFFLLTAEGLDLIETRTRQRDKLRNTFSLTCWKMLYQLRFRRAFHGVEDCPSVSGLKRRRYSWRSFHMVHRGVERDKGLLQYSLVQLLHSVAN